jgi:hypothetical protein
VIEELKRLVEEMPLPLPFQVRAVPIPVPLQFNRAGTHVYRVCDALGNIEADFDNEKSAALFCAAVNAAPALIAAAEAVVAWEAAKTKRINALTGNGDLIEALRDVNVAENNLWLASELLKEPTQ